NGSGLSLNTLTTSGGTATLVSTSTLGNGDKISRYRITGFPGGTFSQGQTITITENLRIDGCTNLSSQVETWYGIDETPCTGGDAVGVATAGADIDNSRLPGIQITAGPATSRCFEGEVIESITIKNTGTASMFNVNIDLWTTLAQSSYFNPNRYIDGIKDITMSIDDGPEEPVNILSTHNFNSPPAFLAGYTGGAIFAIDEIGPNQTVTVRYKVKNRPHIACSIARLDPQALRWSYQTGCGTTVLSPPQNIPLSSTISLTADRPWYADYPANLFPSD